MAFDAFIKIEGIPGDSLDEHHKGWIEVTAYSFGASQSVSSSARSSGGATAGGANLPDFTFSKRLDSASSKLFEAGCKGSHLREVTLSLSRAGGEKLRYFKIQLEEVLISSFSHNGDSGEPLEVISLNFGRINTTYTQQSRTTGQASGNICGGWDRIACKPYA
ncbi:Hcp family type VI secretion system effector [Pseudomonas sp. NPDC090202]|uniref:Hcp family type VI secretion system effector n=1 Tax=unclassified Pseudomonas TaxID=196821 RepID=UPI00380FF57B